MDAAMIVRRVRALSGITRKELAGLAGLAPSTVGRIERGMLDPTWGTLSRILEATGYRISGDSIVSAGDTAAIRAARPVLESRLGRAPKVGSTAIREADRDRRSHAEEWLARWARAGWLSDQADADAVVALAVSAGNAAKITRRNVARGAVAAEDGWQALARRLGEAGIEYAVSGLVAARDDRVMAAAANPVIYVDDPRGVMDRLELDEVAPGSGVLLIAPDDDGPAQGDMEGGIRFVSRAQGVLDAFAGPGREPDKAEEMLRGLLTVGV
ncbi:MAG: helix-turn-helix domain-containing protein [Bifidobacteriaceae bacterium]|nr:helix-turn-helix domain-containing protein [Bifidobacteriaceae bacterium]